MENFYIKLSLWRSPPQSNAGFTLIEMIVVVVLVGVLSAIAAPSWLAFTNRQRVSAVNGAVFQALQTAQSEAKKTKLSYSVSFTNLQVDPANTLSTVPYVAVYKTGTTNPTWSKLGENQQIPTGTVLLGTNLTKENTANTVSNAPLTPPITSTLPTSTTPETITFDYQGNLSSQNGQPVFGPISNPNSRPEGLTIAVAVNNSRKLGGSTRCVIVKTLLGSMQTYQDDDCTPP